MPSFRRSTTSSRLPLGQDENNVKQSQAFRISGPDECIGAPLLPFPSFENAPRVSKVEMHASVRFCRSEWPRLTGFCREGIGFWRSARGRGWWKWLRRWRGRGTIRCRYCRAPRWARCCGALPSPIFSPLRSNRPALLRDGNICRSRRRKSDLACFEEGLRGGFGAVVAEIARLSMTASRRLQLAAESSGTTASPFAAGVGRRRQPLSPSSASGR